MGKNRYSTDEDEDEEVERPAATHFRLFDLPFELRLRVYEYCLVLPTIVDLDTANSRVIVPLLRLFLVNRRMHEETYRVFYGRNTFRVFPVHGRFFHTKAPLLGRLPPRYRAIITKLDLRLGPGWTAPPRCWVVNENLGLADMVKVRLLKIYVECDPSSHPTFEGYGKGMHWYTEFSVELTRKLIIAVPSIIEIEFDGHPGIKRSSPLLQALLDEAKAHNKCVSWGPERRWDKVKEIDMANIQTMMQKLGLDRRNG